MHAGGVDGSATPWARRLNDGTIGTGATPPEPLAKVWEARVGGQTGWKFNEEPCFHRRQTRRLPALHRQAAGLGATMVVVSATMESRRFWMKQAGIGTDPRDNP